MNRHRMPWLLAVLTGLLILRWWDAREPDKVDTLAAAIVRRPAVAASAADIQHPKDLVEAIVALRELEHDEPGNAFARRLPPAPSPPPPPPPAAIVKPFVGPPLPPPPPPAPVAPTPPLQIIGTWEDAHGLSVFLSGPTTTLQARVGDLLLSEYQVVQISPHQVVLRHQPSQLEVRLSLPAGDPQLAARRP